MQKDQPVDSDDVLTATVFVENRPEVVYQLYTSEAGLKEFLAPSVQFNFGLGEKWITCTELGSDLTEPGHVVNKILAYLPNEMLSFGIETAPPYFPYADELKELHTVIQFQPLDNGTLIKGTTLGFEGIVHGKELKEVFRDINTFTLTQLQNKLKGQPINWRSIDDPHSPEKKYKKYISDSVWFKVYQRINNKVIRPIFVAALTDIAKQKGINVSDLGLLYFLGTNVNAEGFGVLNFQFRYPFCNPDFIVAELNKLKDIGLLVVVGDQYGFSEEVKSALKSIVSSVEGRTYSSISESDVTELIEIFSRIRESGLSSSYTSKFPSIRERTGAFIHFENNQSPIVKLMMLMDDLTAMRNDASHYRMNYLQPYVAEKIPLSYPAIEILAVLNAGPFSYNTFARRSTWGYSEVETKNFENELMRFNMAKRSKNDLLVISSKGELIQNKSGIMAEKIFYTPWLQIDEGKYEALNEILKN